MESLRADEQDIAARIFHFLVTPSGTKISHSLSDLAKYSNATEDQLTPMLERLASGGVRILRRVASPLESRYEIFHDALAPAILDWRTRFVQKQELAQVEAQLRKEREDAARRALEQQRELKQAQTLAEAQTQRAEAELARAEEESDASSPSARGQRSIFALPGASAGSSS
jgi:hypothetical protein